jgi:hypothetical protein
VPTDALTVLIERGAEELDLHAELIADNENEEIHGVTWFFPGAKPKVQIDRKLRPEFRRSNRYRTTLAHEYRRLLLHAWLYDHFEGELNNRGAVHCYSRTCRNASIGLVTGWHGKPAIFAGAVDGEN